MTLLYIFFSLSVSPRCFQAHKEKFLPFQPLHVEANRDRLFQAGANKLETAYGKHWRWPHSQSTCHMVDKTIHWIDIKQNQMVELTCTKTCSDCSIHQLSRTLGLCEDVFWWEINKLLQSPPPCLVSLLFDWEIGPCASSLTPSR